MMGNVATMREKLISGSEKHPLAIGTNQLSF